MPVTKSQALRQAVVAVGRFCAYCGARAECADHVVPLFCQGEDCAQNMVASCWHCNSKKNKYRLDAAHEKEVLAGAYMLVGLVNSVAEHFYSAQNRSVSNKLTRKL